MSSLVEQNVVSVADIIVPITGSGLTEFQFDLFDVPGNIPSRIESVTMAVTYPDSSNISDVYEIQLQAQNGFILDRQPSPIIGSGETVDAAYLTWTRRGNDLAQSGVFQFFSVLGPNGTVWWRGTLPDMVLQSLGSVVLNVLRSSDGSYQPATIQDILLTYTPAGGGALGTVADVTPFLLSTTNS